MEPCFPGASLFNPSVFLALGPGHPSSSVWVSVSATTLGMRLWGSHSTVTHALMWDENSLNLSYPSESGTCGFQNQEGTGFPKRGRGSEEKGMKGWGGGGEGQDQPSTMPNLLRAGLGRMLPADKQVNPT